jgi:uncharacterized damage-inducible protein DinB
MKSWPAKFCSLIFIFALDTFVSSAQPSTATKPLASQTGPASSEALNHRESLVMVWTRARDWTKEYLAKMPEESYGLKPVPEVRSFAEQMLHLAGGNFGYGAMIFGKAPPYRQPDLAKDEFKTKAGLIKIVTESYDFIIDGLEASNEARLIEQITGRGGVKLTRQAMLMNAFEHQTHHRGQTTLYLRMKGITPPPEPA